MPYAEVLVLVAAVVVVFGAAALLFVVVVAAGALAGGRTAGAALAVDAVVLLSGVVDTGTAGVVAAGVAAAGVVPAAVTADGVETAGVATGVGLATTDAAVTESEFVPPPPPPHAARDVATSAERTRKVIVLDEVFMSIYSELRSVDCYRLFIVGLWNNSILIHSNRFHTEKVVFQQHNVSICHKNLTHFPLSLKDCYR